MKGILDCAMCPISVLPMFRTLRRQRFICPDVADQKTLSNRMYLREQLFRGRSSQEIIETTHEDVLKEESSAGGLRNGWGNCVVLHKTE